MIFGMSTACFFSRLLTEDAVKKMYEMGITDAEVFLCSASEYRLPFIRELKTRLDDCGMRAHSVHALSVQFEPQLFTSHARARSDAYGVYEEVLEAARLLGADMYTFHGLVNLKKVKNPFGDMEKIAQNASAAAEKAREYGVKLAWENVFWCVFNRPEFIHKLESYGISDNLYYTLDIKQAVQADVLPEDFVFSMGARLVNVHLCDYIDDAEKGFITRLPFEGHINFAALKSALTGIGYQGPLIYEVYASDYTDESQLKENYFKTKAFFDERQ
jgi:sugar phosphate isomerase/epimerase